MEPQEPMRLEFYKQNAGSPRYFDVLTNKDGTILVINPRALRNKRLIVVMEQGQPLTPTPFSLWRFTG